MLLAWDRHCKAADPNALRDDSKSQRFVGLPDHPQIKKSRQHVFLSVNQIYLIIKNSECC